MDKENHLILTIIIVFLFIKSYYLFTEVPNLYIIGIYMKQLWLKDELIEFFTLSEEELNLIKDKPHGTMLGFAMLLVFFKHEGRFPQSSFEVPKLLVKHIASQLNTGVIL